MRKTYEIEIPNWSEYNPRGKEKKKTRHHWYRCEAHLFEHPEFLNFSAEEIAVFHYVLSMTCLMQGRRWRCDLELCSKAARVTPTVFQSAIDKLLELQVVRTHESCRTNKETSSYDQIDSVGHTDGRTNVRTSNKSSGSTSRMTPDRLLEIWNEHRGQMIEAKKLNEKRRKIARARLAECPDEQYWLGTIRQMARTPFLTGENDRGWRAGFDFLIKSDTHLKVSEGFYGDLGPEPVTPEQAEKRRKALWEGTDFQKPMFASESEQSECESTNPTTTN